MKKNSNYYFLCLFVFSYSNKAKNRRKKKTNRNGIYFVLFFCVDQKREVDLIKNKKKRGNYYNRKEKDEYIKVITFFL